MPVVTIEYSDFQDVQVIHDRMNIAKYILSSNVRICERYQGYLYGSPNVDMLLEELKLQGSRVDNLLERTRSGSGLVSELLSGVLGRADVLFRCKILSRSVGLMP